MCIATDVGAIAKLSSWKFKPPSSRIEDKISITPFSVDKKSTINNVESSVAVSSAADLDSSAKIVNVSEFSLKFNVKKESDKSRTLCMD